MLNVCVCTSVQDAPGLAFNEPYRLEIFQQAIRMYPAFAAILVVSDRSKAASGEAQKCL